MTPVPLTTPRQNPTERRAIIEAAEMPDSIPALLDAATADSPNSILWEFFDDGISATYAQVRDESLRYGALLASFGVERGDRVAVMLPNVPAMPLVWLGLGRIGGVMVPVNTRYSARELTFLIEDSGARLLLIHQECADVLKNCELNIDVYIVGSNDWSKRVRETMPGDCPAPEIHGQDLVNIQYTSGTTGLPKGCLLTHRYWLTTGMVNAWRDGRRFRRILATTPFSYMDPQWLLLMAVYQRATLVVGRKQSASKFARWLSEHRIEFCLFPEAASKQPPTSHDAENPVIRANIYGVRASVHAEIENRYGLTAREAFGMTEIGSGLFMPMEASGMTGSGSCGIASPFRETRIVDDEGNNVPDGEIGELLIRGPDIFLGYHANPTASAEALRDGWFHTGDLFWRDSRGYHFIVGRKKDMIRRSGENIACREVEGVLRDMAEIEEVALIPVCDELRGEEVKAYLVVQDGQLANEALIGQIVDYASQRLAAFKVPRYFEFIDIMPRTPSFKVAKAELVNARKDHRTGTFDRVENTWR
ncbi:AMP-binding protein [Sulfitobacter sp. F26204]|uniref:class I adenylate-forming enzyme family protein n=1 Tax=Sulfitobacter sp. F26204 TaxID=2996014 RepID=UPI00225E52D2|nr:AMP-binding protein [Sulfitobacter sp. F26204]MCX7561249.1 AMP-binding protein [Sulfitobacter sp. F26204]